MIFILLREAHRPWIRFIKSLVCLLHDLDILRFHCSLAYSLHELGHHQLPNRRWSLSILGESMNKVGKRMVCLNTMRRSTRAFLGYGGDWVHCLYTTIPRGNTIGQSTPINTSIGFLVLKQIYNAPWRHQRPCLSLSLSHLGRGGGGT